MCLVSLKEEAETPEGHTPVSRPTEEAAGGLPSASQGEAVEDTNPANSLILDSRAVRK